MYDWVIFNVPAVLVVGYCQSMLAAQLQRDHVYFRDNHMATQSVMFEHIWSANKTSDLLVLPLVGIGIFKKKLGSESQNTL